jgi:hypothetical protein
MFTICSTDTITHLKVPSVDPTPGNGVFSTGFKTSGINCVPCRLVYTIRHLDGA